LHQVGDLFELNVKFGAKRLIKSCRQSHVAFRKLWTSLWHTDILSLLFSRQLGREVTL